MAADVVDPNMCADLMVEATRVVSVGPDAVIFCFQMFDAEDSTAEQSIFFRATGFKKVERLASIKEQIFDIFYDAGAKELWGLERRRVHRLTGTFKTPKTTEVPLPQGRGLEAFAGRSSKDLYAVGDTIVHYDGKKWTEIARKNPSSSSDTTGTLRRAEVSSNGAAYALGDDGVLLEITAKGTTKPIKLPLKTEPKLQCLSVDSLGKSGGDKDIVLSIGGDDGLCLQGPPGDLTLLKGPNGVAGMGGVCAWKGKFYWSAYGDVGGVYVQEGKKLVSIFEHNCWHLTPTENYLYASSEREVFRFDGKKWLTLGLTFDNDKEKWVVAPAEAGDAYLVDDDDGDDDDD